MQSHNRWRRAALTLPLLVLLSISGLPAGSLAEEGVGSKTPEIPARPSTPNTPETPPAPSTPETPKTTEIPASPSTPPTPIPPTPPVTPASSPSPPTAQAESARALLDAVDDLYRSNQSRARIRMEVKTPNWARTLELEGWSKGQDWSLFRILAPKKEKGNATLRRDNEIWNYLPKVRRVMKLPSSMMSASWMGSDFSNDDLVKESRMTRDYDFRFGDVTEADGQAVREILCVPKPDVPVVWGQLSVLVTASENPIPVRITYFDEDLNEARTMRFSDVQELGGRNVPTRLTLQPSDEPDRQTVMVYEELDFDIDIPDSVFTLQNLKR